MISDPNQYLRRDLTTLLILVAVLSAIVVGLWYIEQTSGGFSAFAKAHLTF